MPPLRVCYFVAAIGFGLTGAGSAMGAAPSWPNRMTWCVVAVIAVVALLTYAIRPSPLALSFATSTVVVAGAARVIGWVYSNPSLASRLSATGVWIVVCALMFCLHHKARTAWARL